MLIQSTFSYNDPRNLIKKNIKIFISDRICNMIGLNHREVTTLPAKMWIHYPLLGITLYTLCNNKYYSLK